jgi:RNA polymerase sigma factor (sigma-70 family)
MEGNETSLELRLDSPHTLALVRRKARKLARLGISGDADDIAQELALRLVRKRSRFAASRGNPQAFLSVVVESEAVSFIRHERAQRRYAGSQRSLSAPITEDGTSLADLVVSGDTDDHRSSDIRQDVATIVGQLSRRDRRLCRLAMRFSVTEISRMTGLPRTTIQSRLQRLRKAFLGLEDSL